jgi:hypothetical protein
MRRKYSHNNFLLWRRSRDFLLLGVDGFLMTRSPINRTGRQIILTMVATVAAETTGVMMRTTRIIKGPREDVWAQRDQELLEIAQELPGSYKHMCKWISVVTTTSKKRVQGKDATSLGISGT